MRNDIDVEGKEEELRLRLSLRLDFGVVVLWWWLVVILISEYS